MLNLKNYLSALHIISITLIIISVHVRLLIFTDRSSLPDNGRYWRGPFLRITRDPMPSTSKAFLEIKSD